MRVIIPRQWEKPKTILRNLTSLNKTFRCNFTITNEDIWEIANLLLGWYRGNGLIVVAYLLSFKVLTLPNKQENRSGAVYLLAYLLE